MEIDSITALASFAPSFRNASSQFGEMKTTCVDASGNEVLGMPYVAFSELGNQFVDMCYDRNWIETGFDWGTWIETDEAQLLIKNPRALADVDVQTLRHLLTALVRQERISDGTLNTAFDSGLLLAIAERAQALSVADPNPSNSLRKCLHEPIPEIFAAAFYLDAAVSAHLAGKRSVADELIRRADIPAIADWTESLWGKGGPWTKPLPVKKPLPFVAHDERLKARMPSKAEQLSLLERDGFQCRFCGIPLVRAETRSLICQEFAQALRWGNRNKHQHAGFQAMWLQFDHLVPHARGGTNDLSNMLVTCAPCNNGRSNLSLEEVGLADPRLRDPLRSTWDGLERFRLGHRLIKRIQIRAAASWTRAR